MDKKTLVRRVEVARGKRKADLVLKNCKVVDVYSEQIIEGDIAMVDGVIAGVGTYEGEKEIDAQGLYAAPGFIDGHIHIESAHVAPEEMGRICVPHGTTTLIADPHEIVNVAGLTGMRYMMDASEKTALDIKYMLPSCVPATPFENAGAIVDAKKMEEIIDDERILGLGEFMNYPGILNCADTDVDKLLLAINKDIIIDGHSPALSGADLSAYASVHIHDDHECSSVAEMDDRISRGMYILLRQGTACHDLPILLKGMTPAKARRCLLCSDDRMPNTIFTKGHLEEHLRLCVQMGVEPITAIQMASLNAAECFRLYDRGAIAPGLRGDIVLFDSLTDFNVKQVFIAGQKVAENGEYLLPVERQDITPVKGSFHVKDLSLERFKMNLKSDKVWTIDMLPGGVLTHKGEATIRRTEDGDFLYDPSQDIVKVAVVERHHGTGNIALGLLRGYGIKEGAMAVSFAHDSHNIIVAGTNDLDMLVAVQGLIDIQGGITQAVNGHVINGVSMPIAGLMTDASAEEITAQLQQVDYVAYKRLGISEDVDPVTTLCFMALPVIPEIKLTDIGLFDVTKFDFIDIERE